MVDGAGDVIGPFFRELHLPDLPSVDTESAVLKQHRWTLRMELAMTVRPNAEEMWPAIEQINEAHRFASFDANRSLHEASRRQVDLVRLRAGRELRPERRGRRDFWRGCAGRQEDERRQDECSAEKGQLLHKVCVLNKGATRGQLGSSDSRHYSISCVYRLPSEKSRSQKRGGSFSGECSRPDAATEP